MNPVETRLVEAMQAFAVRQADFLSDHDAGALAAATFTFREELDLAAREGVEHWQAWHLISARIEDPQDRLYCLRRVLATLQAGRATPASPHRDRIISSHNFVRAQCLVQMAEIHLREKARDEARECYERALPLARAAFDVQGVAAEAGLGCASLEGKIVAALRMLDTGK